MGTLDRSEYERLTRWIGGAFNATAMGMAAMFALWAVHTIGAPLPWSTEVSGFAAAVTVMLGSALRIAWWIAAPKLDHGIR